MDKVNNIIAYMKSNPCKRSVQWHNTTFWKWDEKGMVLEHTKTEGYENCVLKIDGNIIVAKHLDLEMGVWDNIKLGMVLMLEELEIQRAEGAVEKSLEKFASPETHEPPPQKTVYLLGIGRWTTYMRIIDVYDTYDKASKEAKAFIEDDGYAPEYIKILELPLL